MDSNELSDDQDTVPEFIQYLSSDMHIRVEWPFNASAYNLKLIRQKREIQEPSEPTPPPDDPMESD